MPGPVSDPRRGTPADTPYVPPWCYPDGKPLMCPCGHHEGYHDDHGVCLLRGACGCTGLPDSCRTPLERIGEPEAA